MCIKVLLLAGGQSSRMGSRKELLRLPNGLPLYLHLIKVLENACPDVGVFHISLRDKGAIQALRANEHVTIIAEDILKFSLERQVTIRIVYDEIAQEIRQGGSIGPAAGLLAAYHMDSTSSWLVVACDFPLLTVSTVQLLRHEFTAPLTCYRNAKGYYEPFLAVWTPDALRRLEENVEKGISSPSRVIHQLSAKSISAKDEKWLFNSNTILEWREALDHLSRVDSGGLPQGDERSIDL